MADVELGFIQITMKLYIVQKKLVMYILLIFFIYLLSLLFNQILFFFLFLYPLPSLFLFTFSYQLGQLLVGFSFALEILVRL